MYELLSYCWPRRMNSEEYTLFLQSFICRRRCEVTAVVIICIHICICNVCMHVNEHIRNVFVVNAKRSILIAFVIEPFPIDHMPAIHLHPYVNYEQTIQPSFCIIKINFLGIAIFSIGEILLITDFRALDQHIYACWVVWIHEHSSFHAVNRTRVIVSDRFGLSTREQKQ